MNNQKITDDYTIDLRENDYKFVIHFVNIKVDTMYGVGISIFNNHDKNPLNIMATVTEKHRDRFNVTLTETPDSPNYKMHYSVVAEDSHPNTIENILDIPAKSCDHKWVEYKGFTDKYEFCKHCDTKR